MVKFLDLWKNYFVHTSVLGGKSINKKNEIKIFYMSKR